MTPFAELRIVGFATKGFAKLQASLLYPLLRERAGVRILSTKSSRFEPLNLPAAGFATTLFAPSRRAAAIPSPGGLPLLGKQRKEFAPAKALGAERVGTSESLGQGEGGLPSIQYVPAPCNRRFMERAVVTPSDLLACIKHGFAGREREVSKPYRHFLPFFILHSAFFL